MTDWAKFARIPILGARICFYRFTATRRLARQAGLKLCIVLAVARGVTDYLQGTAPIPDTVDIPKNKPAGNLSEHFSTDEFACHHCGQCGDMHPKLIELLEKLRANMGGVPIHINSGYRCPIHNANVGGVPNSQHVLGTAADLAVPAGMSFDTFQWYVEQLPFDGIGLYPYQDFIHVDVCDGGIGSKIYWEG